MHLNRSVHFSQKVVGMTLRDRSTSELNLVSRIIIRYDSLSTIYHLNVFQLKSKVLSHSTMITFTDIQCNVCIMIYNVMSVLSDWYGTGEAPVVLSFHRPVACLILMQLWGWEWRGGLEALSVGVVSGVVCILLGWALLGLFFAAPVWGFWKEPQ